MSKKKEPTKTSTKSETGTRHRNAETGQFVSKGYAERHPKTTVKEKGKKDKGGTDHTGPRHK
ncbi:MAG: hypothetical protein IPN99_09860 [Bacteroidetes bacterium]|nr:hypothetical protein [Bacteroidota bacterium]